MRATAGTSDWLLCFAGPAELLEQEARVSAPRRANIANERLERDRSRIQQDVVEAVRDGRLDEPVVVVIEGTARSDMEESMADGVTVIHAPGRGDETLFFVAAEADSQVVLVSADRDLLRRGKDLGAEVQRPGWLIDLLDG